MNHSRGSFQFKKAGIYHANQRTSDNAIGSLTPSSFYATRGKRALDVLFVLLGIPILLPIMLLIALVIKLSGGPVMYSQRRVGIGGQEFNFLKFRSMVPNADNLLSKHLEQNPAAAAEWETKQKLEQDPRVTKFGRFLRMTSLDELPQMWNVLVGDMSLVGPRPIMPVQQTLYFGREYNFLKPGITGLWQVSERNQVDFAQRAIFDSAYAKDMSLSLDLKILLQTIGVILNRTGT